MSLVPTQPRRLLSAGLAALLGVAFVAAALLLGATLNATVEASAAGPVGQAAIVVTPGARQGQVSHAYADALGRLPGVTGVRPEITRPVLVPGAGGGRPLTVSTLPTAAGAATLVTGRLPAVRGEVVVNQAAAGSPGVAVGQPITLVSLDDGPTTARRPVTFLVVGVIRPALDSGISGDLPVLLGANADLERVAGVGYDAVYVDGTTTPEAARAVPGAAGFTVRTGAQETAERVRVATEDTQAMTALLLCFAAVSVLVSGIVIANTSSILVAQRARELALLRSVGATRRQVFGGVLREALVLAAVSSVLGLGLAVGVVAALAAWSRGTPAELVGVHVTPLSVVVPLAVGIGVTLLASLAPARRATRVPPLAALRPDAVPPAKTTAGRVRIAVGLLATVGGLALLGTQALAHRLLPAILGGAASVLGVVLLGSLVVPPVVRLLGALPARVAGVPARLAVDNARRNPARAAATATALFVGVTLITLMTVGAATGQATVAVAMDRHTPVDAVVGVGPGQERAAYDAAARSSGVVAVTRVYGATATVSADGERPRTLEVRGLEPDAGRVVRYAAFVDGVRDDAILLAPGIGIPDGATVRLTIEGRSVTVRAVVRAEAGTGGVVTAATLCSLAPTAPALLWVRFADDRQTQAAVDTLATTVQAVAPGAQVGGPVAERAGVQRALDLVLAVVTGLLGVAVVIALVGVGNTLGLSVLERTRETGLLRALGVTRRQVRTMLGIEALTLAGVGVTLGLGLGVLYGIAAVHALIGAQARVVVAVPAERLALVAAVSLAAGWLASVLPSRRAAAVSPSAALATD